MAYKKCLIATTKNLFIYDAIAKYNYHKDYKKYNSDNVIFFKAGTYSITTTNAGSAAYCQAFSEPNIAITNIFDVISYDSSLSIYMYKAWDDYALSIRFKQDKVLQFTLLKDCYLTFCADPNVVPNPMIELGTVGTSYVPYGYLPSYKKIIKVNNNPVQLFIPSNTKTVAGVTITNNGDGSLTINGTGTGSDPYTNFTAISKNYMKYNLEDKIFISAYVISGTCSNLGASFSQTGNPYVLLSNPTEETYYAGNIYKKDRQTDIDAIGFYVGNYTFNNLRVKFNVINLTAMFGKGNEPSTVSEFRAKYPNDYYEYNPSQYLVSYRKNLVTDGSTKNLFDFSKFYKNTYSNVANGVLVEKLSNGAIAQGNNGTGGGDNYYANGWFTPTNYPISLKTHLKAGTYTVSADYTMIENSFVSTAQVGCYLYGDHEYIRYPTPVTVGNTVRMKNTYTVGDGY